MQTLSFSYALFAAVFGLFSFAALYARNVGPVFGLTFERLANPVFSFGVMIAVLAVANSFVPPLVPTLGVLIALGSASLVTMFYLKRHKAEKAATMMEIVFNIFLGSSVLLNISHGPFQGTVFGMYSSFVMTILYAALIAVISLRTEKPLATAA